MIVKLSSNRTFMSWIIRKLTRSEYSHVDIQMSPGLYIGSQPGIGVVIHQEVCDTEHFYEIDIDDLECIRFAIEQLNKPYDYTGILGYLFNRRWQDDDSWFCSELVAASINKQKKIFGEEMYRVTPGDLVKHPEFRRIL